MEGDLSGHKIRGYTIKERIGSGGYGVVYRAFQPSVDREVAIKVVLPSRAKSDYFVKRFDEEAHLVAKLEHPFIVPLYDYWHEDDQACLVMRWLHGGSLRDVLINGSMADEEIGQMVEQIGGALKLAHANGVVHRDIKPDNILLDENGNYYLTDFGIAKDLKGEISSITSSGTVTGTPAYLSPEQGMAKRVTSRSDIYSLGVVLYEVLTGEHPFPEADPTTQILHHISDPLPKISEKRPDLPREVDEVVETATAKEPEDRYESVDEFVADFKAARGAGEVKARKAVPGILEKRLGVKAHVPGFIEDDAGEKALEVFVGRDSQLETLNGFLNEAISGKGKLVFVTGEAGRGKSALIEAFGRRATERNDELIVAMGKCQAFTGAGDPYLPFREALGMLTGDVEAQLASKKITREQALRLWHLLPTTCEALTSGGIDLLGTLVAKRELAERAAGYESEGATWQTQLARALADTGPLGELKEIGQIEIHQEYLRVLKNISKKRPLLLFLDDLHWVDQASASLLAHIAGEIRDNRILLVGAYRGEELHEAADGGAHALERELSEFKRQFGDIWINMDDSEATDNLDFVNAFLDTDANNFSEKFRKEFAQHTDGHGLFVRELLIDMQEHGDIVRGEGGAWEIGDNLKWNRIPARVEGVIEKRVERLDEDLRELIEAASVEGVEFTAEVVSKVIGQEARSVTREISRRLNREHRLVEDIGINKVGEQRVTQFRFQHELIQKFIYQRLGENERALLHEDVGNVMEEIYGEHAEEHAGKLAGHFDIAGNGNQAVRYYMAAGNQASEVYSYSQAADSYKRAVELYMQDGDTGGAARVLMTLGMAYHLLADFDESRKAYDEGFRLFKEGASLREIGSTQPAPRPLLLVGAPPITFDPTHVGDAQSGFYMDQIYSGLAQFDNHNEVIPDIAERWEIKNEGRKYIFFLREDAKWSDGAKVTAQDFVLAWRRVLDPKHDSPSAKILEIIKNGRAIQQGKITDIEALGVKAVDPKTLEVELEFPTFYFPYVIAYSGCFPIPEHAVREYGDDWNKPENLVTNGGFKMDEYNKDEKLILSRNTHYSGRMGGNVEKVSISFPKYASEDYLKMYEENLLDVVRMDILDDKERKIARRRFKNDIFIEPNLITWWIILNTQKSPFNDRRVRRALAHAINKEALATEILDGNFSPALGGMVPEGLPGHSADIGIPFNLEKANELLFEAGYTKKNPLPAMKGVSYSFMHFQIAKSVAKLWKETLGLEIDWSILEAGKSPKTSGRGGPDLVAGGWVADYPDAHSFLQSNEYAKIAGWDHTPVLELLHKAIGLKDIKKRLDLYREADEMIINEVPIVPILYPKRQFMVKPDVAFSFYPNQQALKGAVIKPPDDA